MCGPILVGFSQAFTRVSLTVHGHGEARGISLDFVWYHAGRIWTYGALGFVVGLLSQTLRFGSAWLGWQYAAGIVLSTAVIVSGIALLGIIPGQRFERFLNRYVFSRLQNVPWIKSLTLGYGLAPRLLLGAIMGLLPCGLVYAMLAVVAGLPSPWHSAAGMIVFGLGTLPSMMSVSLLNRFLPQKVRAHGTTMTAVMVMVAGVWMMGRTVLPHRHDLGGDHSAHHHTD